MNRSWVRFPQAAQIRPPGSGWAFLYALTGRAAWCARGRRPAREIATREPAARSDRSRGPPWPRRRPRAPQPGPPIPPAPSTPVGPGRCVCRWAAARPRDRHTRASGSEWSISRPALALPPPTGTAARPRRSRGGLQSGVRACPGPAAALRHRGLAPQATRWPSCLCCLRRRWCSGRRRARPPTRLGDLTSFGAASRSPPVPSGPSGALHTGGACGSGVSVLALALPPHSAWGYAESVGGSG